jgi:hypothetical protein
MTVSAEEVDRQLNSRFLTTIKLKGVELVGLLRLVDKPENPLWLKTSSKLFQ